MVSIGRRKQNAYNWLTNYLQGLYRENSDYLYINLNEFLQSFVLRNIHCSVILPRVFQNLSKVETTPITTENEELIYSAA